MFIRNETFYSYRKNYPVITTLTIIHLILFLWINLSYLTGGGIPLGRLILHLGLGNTGAIADGEYWRLISPIFLHEGMQHVLFNSISLILFGPALEKMLGPGKFLFTYLAAGILANVGTFLLTAGILPDIGIFSFTNPYYSHIGASGAIFGLFGVYLYMVLNRKDLIDAVNAQIISIILILGVVMTFLNPGINILGHLFGLIAGAAMAPLVLKNAAPFYMQAGPTVSKGNVAFNPNRWQKRRIFTGRGFARAAGWAFVVLVIIGILSNLF